MATFVASPTGNDSTGTGSEANPYRTAGKAAKDAGASGPGGIAYLRGGGAGYTEYWAGSAYNLADGSLASPCLLAGFPGDARPVFTGILGLLHAPDYWTFEDLSFRWTNAAITSTDPNGTGYTRTPDHDTHWCQLFGGTGWRFTDCDWDGGESYSFLNLEIDGASKPTNWAIDNCVFRNAPSAATTGHGANQDHFVYLPHAATGVIERNLMIGVENGFWVKFGPPPGTPTNPPIGVTMRYNSCYNGAVYGLGFAYGAANNIVEDNIFHTLSGQLTTPFALVGTGNVLRRNVWTALTALLRANGTDGSSANITDNGDNLNIDPQYTSVVFGSEDLHPLNAPALAYGRYAGLDGGGGDPVSAGMRRAAPGRRAAMRRAAVVR